MKSSYTYAGAQVLRQRAYNGQNDPNFSPADPNFYQDRFYVHDRLGSVRLVVDYNDIDDYVSVANSYTYTPFGSHYDGEAPAETVDNPFKFTGQWHDSEINQYHLRARMYDPTMMRFTARDPVRGEQKEPLTLHKYLYTANDPINRIDLTGKSMASILVEPIMAGHSVHGTATMITAIGVANMNWNMISFGIALDRTIAPVMAITMMSRKGRAPRDHVRDMIDDYEQGYNNNMGGGGWNNLPKWAAIGTGLVLIAAEMRGCDEELQGVADFLEFLNGKDREDDSQFEQSP